MAVLLLIGEEKEKPEIVKDLLNVEKQSSKPHYPLALDSPLILHNCEYDDVTWKYDQYVIRRVISDFQRIWAEHALKAKMVKEMIVDLESRLSESVDDHHALLLPGNRSKSHIPLLKRQTGDSVEEKIAKSTKKAKTKEMINKPM